MSQGGIDPAIRVTTDNGFSSKIIVRAGASRAEFATPGTTHTFRESMDSKEH